MVQQCVASRTVRTTTKRLLVLNHYYWIASAVFISTTTTTTTRSFFTYNNQIPFASGVANPTSIDTCSSRTISTCSTTTRRMSSTSTTSVGGSTNSTSSLNDDIMSRIHPIGFGTFMIDRDSTVETIRQAIMDGGYRRIDCAPVYFNEDKIGDALTSIFNDSTVSIQRSDLFLVSKVPGPFHSNPKLALQKILTDLQTPYLDLLLIHWPVAMKPIALDPNVRGYTNEDIDDSNNGYNIDTKQSIHDTWQAMEQLVKDGLVRYIGVSNFPVILLHELLTKATIRPLVNQCECHPYLQQNELIRYCHARNIHFQAYSPLGASKEYRTNDIDPIVVNDPILQEIATRYNISVPTLCIVWLLQRNVSVVVKSTNLQHIQDNLAVPLQLFQNNPTPIQNDDLQLISSLNRNYRYFRPQEWWDHMPVAVFH